MTPAEKLELEMRRALDPYLHDVITLTARNDAIRAALAVALEAVESAIEREARRLGPAFFPDDAVSVVRSLLPPRSEERT